MKAYVMTTGILFGLLTMAHVWRVVEEGRHLAADPGMFSSRLRQRRCVSGRGDCFASRREREAPGEIDLSPAPVAKTQGYQARERVLRRLRAHLERHHHPRLAMCAVLALGGLAGFLTSAGFLQAGLRSMAWRYGLGRGQRTG
jgi:hypothetical protein